MSTFRESELEAARLLEATTVDAASAAPEGAQDGMPVHDRSIGDIIRELRNLSAEQVEAVLAHQRAHGVRFGEAAVALKLVTPDDVLYALSQQFHYPYAPEEHRKDSPELVALNQPFSAQAEAFRALRSQVIMRVWAEHTPRRALAVISADHDDGKTFFAANLAVSLAQLGGGRTLLVDANLRGPRQHEVFKLDNRSGLSGILSGRADKDVIQPVDYVPGLFVLAAGTTPPNPLELVERPAFGLLMRELASKFDHVVVDTPAAASGADASVISARCGAAIVLARKDQSRVAALQDLMASLDGTAVRLAGVVVNEF
ncbi:MAG: polysaccharide biosynthesis tyrosine autokinase [Rubrivivax sp.]|nr:polysaccharide biosynthesis tyrosine autokinase [Rubrivivax sp.]